MYSSSPSSMAAPPLHLAIAADSHAEFWQHSAMAYSNPGSRWCAAVNQACLSAVLAWIQSEQDRSAQIWTNAANRASFWEVVNGGAIDLHGRRLVLIPTTAIDFAELQVPQEWVDLPSWAGDYYLSIYVDLDDLEIQVLGYATHRQLQQQGEYDPLDRTYHLPGDSLITDLNVLWLTQQLCPTEVYRSPLNILPPLPLVQAENLLLRLGEPNQLRSRLAIPFILWGAIMEHGGWRQQLYRHRLGLPEPWSIADWWEAGISQFAQQLGWETVTLEPSLVLARSANQMAPKILLRQLMISGQPYQLRVFPTGNDLWRFELHSTSTNPIPPGTKLRLLTEDLLAFDNNEDLALAETDRLYLEVRVNQGDGLVWETTPQPDLFDREILRF
jgi:Protein of unknown function (DUF1822)